MINMNAYIDIILMCDIIKNCVLLRNGVDSQKCLCLKKFVLKFWRCASPKFDENDNMIVCGDAESGGTDLIWRFPKITHRFVGLIVYNSPLS